MPVPTDRAFGAYTTKKGETLRSLRLNRCEFGGWKRSLPMCSARRVVPTIVPEPRQNLVSGANASQRARSVK